MTPSEAIEHHATELAWSLWTELGVPGVIRRHASVVVDPEPLLVATPLLARADQRLQEQALRWWDAHVDRLSVSRLAGLARALAPETRAVYDAFAARRGKPAGATRAVRPVAAAVRERAASRLPVERPSLLRLRVRALCGVGARADVLTDLLLGRSQWSRASELATAGYSKRTVARILTELADAGIAARRTEGNALRFRLADAAALSSLVRDEGLPEPRWPLVFGALTELLALVRSEPSPDAVRRVAAHSARESLAASCALLEWSPPPPTRGVPSAWDDLLAWGGATLGRLAAGTVVAS